jgi:hypothetical protein
MEVRKRTRSGKSTKQEIAQPLKLVARDTLSGSVTLAFALRFFETHFSIELSKTEARELAESILKNLSKD